jgi:RNA polymerase sigma factor (sigma-70 family)
VSVQAIDTQRGLSGEDRAVELDSLFRLYARELNGLAYRRLRDREAAADLVQDGFVRYLAWRRAREIPTSVLDARNVLWRVVSNLTVDFVRQKRARGTPTPLDLIGEIADPYPTQDRFIEGRQAYRLVKAALDASPPMQRNVLLLNRIGGLTHAEIAQRLGISTSTVSKYVVAVLDRCLMRLSAIID